MKRSKLIAAFIGLSSFFLPSFIHAQGIGEQIIWEDNKQIDISAWKSGIYAVRVSCGEQSISIKIAKN